MKLHLHNTLSGKKEEFVPLHDKEVGLYSCGPTVYWYQHIGNLRSYIFVDILKRVLKYDGYAVKHVMNVTDVGHLTSDADTGEDKMEKAAAQEGKKAEDIANYYLNIFKDDFHKLNISEPDIWCKATEHIQEQVEMIKILEAKGLTYKTNDGIYFDTSKIDDYGKLARLHIEDMEAGARVELGEKKNKTDFALWKFSGEKGRRLQEWGSPWGVGFPGWHIECSTMASKYLGEQFDVHTGGKEHVPVHHTNEIAQSEAAFGKKPWVKYWLHGEWLMFKDGKMSKSAGEIYTVAELEKRGFSPLAYRYFCLGAHYKKPLNFDWEALTNAQNAYDRLKNIIAEFKDDGQTNEQYLTAFADAINDDLDMPGALAILWEMLRDQRAEGKLRAVRKMEEIFGLDLLKKENVEIPAEIKKLAAERETARQSKDWAKADELRKVLEEKGFLIKDTPEGFEITKT